MIMSAYDWGVAHGSCKPALAARKELGPEKSQPDWWKICDRGEWLIWQLSNGLSEDELRDVIPALLRAVNNIVDRAVKNYCLKCGLESVESWAKAWLNKTDRQPYADRAAARAISIADNAAYAAANAAYAAYAASDAADDAAYAAADAAYAAANAASNAAYAASDAAYADEQKQQAIDIRAEIPEWPGV